MPRIRVRRTIDAPVDVVWDALADIAAHVEWMADARAIRFTSATETGVGTTFDCETKVGPFRLIDRMAVTAWEPDQSMAVRHVGLVTGEGRFTLQPAARGRTDLVWEESLSFPRWIPSRPAAIVLKQIWRRNLWRFERTLGITGGRDGRRRGRRQHRAP